jgi:lipopolysaccharide transport system permease protein
VLHGLSFALSHHARLYGGFRRIAKLPSEGTAPCSVLLFAAMLPWQFFASSLTESSNSLLSNVNLVCKIYFPRLIVPASSIITGFVDFLISFGILLLVIDWYRYSPDWHIPFRGCKQTPVVGIVGSYQL